MMIGRTRLAVGPLRDLAQLDATLDRLRGIPGVGGVSVDAFVDRRALLSLQVLRPVDLRSELRLALGAGLASCVVATDRLEVVLRDASRADGGGTDVGAVGTSRDAPATAAPAGSWSAAPTEAADPFGSPWGPVARTWDAVAPAVVEEDRPVAPPAIAEALLTAPADLVPRDRAGLPDALERAAGSAELVLSALESMGDVSILVFDGETRFRASAGAAITRHGRRHEELVGRRAPEALAPETWRRLAPGYATALAGGTTTIEIAVPGHGAVYETTFSPIRDGATVVGGTAVSRDVTARRREVAREAEAGELLELSFAHAPIAKALISPDGRWLRVNRRLCELLGRDEETLLRCGLQELTHPEDVTSDLDLSREVLLGLRDRYAVDKRYLHADGRVVPARLQVSLVRSAAGDPRWFVFEIAEQAVADAARPRLPAVACAPA